MADLIHPSSFLLLHFESEYIMNPTIVATALYLPDISRSQVTLNLAAQVT
jgi:hypothetical protein